MRTSLELLEFLRTISLREATNSAGRLDGSCKLLMILCKKNCVSELARQDKPGNKRLSANLPSGIKRLSAKFLTGPLVTKTIARNVPAKI